MIAHNLESDRALRGDYEAVLASLRDRSADGKPFRLPAHMPDGKTGGKRAFIMLLWRLQQSQMIIGVVVWSIILSVTAYPYGAPLLAAVGIPYNQVALGFLVVLALVSAVILGIGFAYDRVFRLWRETAIFTIERNPYYREKMYAKEVLMFEHLYLPILEDAEERRGRKGEGSALARKLVERNLDSDAALKAEYADLRRMLKKD
jgi:hypothetical protein